MRDEVPTLIECPRCESSASSTRQGLGYWCHACDLLYTGSSSEWAAYHPLDSELEARRAAHERQVELDRAGLAAARAQLQASHR